MDGKRFSNISPPVAKRMRYDQPNASNIVSNPSKTPYSLATCLQKVQHLLRNPVQIEQAKKNSPETPYSLATCLQKVQHLIRDPAQIERVKKTQSAQQNEKVPQQQPNAKCQLKYDRSFLIKESLRKVRHLLRDPPKSQHDDKSEQAHEIDDSDPSQSLMILVDDCLLEIFDYLKPVDLINIANVNKRLNKLVKFYVQTKNKVEFVPNGNWIEHDRINVEALQVFLGIFGGEIQSLTLNRKSFDNTFNDYGDMDRILRFIQAYCHLTELTLIGFGMCGLMQRFCSQLKSLTLDDCSVTRDWVGMGQLTTLKLNKLIFRRYPFEHSYSFDREYRMPSKPIQIPFHRFGNLKKVELVDVNVDNNNVVKLIKSNRNLKSLSIVKCIEISPFVCEAVSGLKHLEEFEYKTKKPFMNSLFHSVASLKKLKVLKLTHPNISMPQSLFDKLVANGITLEHLELGLTPLNSSLTESIAKMQSIKILKLDEMTGLNESHVTRIVSQLKLLQELHVKSQSTITQNGIKDIVRSANHLTCLKMDAPGFVLDVETYQSLLVTVQARETQSKLRLTIYGNGNQVTVPGGLMSGSNEKWLAVEELDRNEHHLFEDLTSKVGHPPPRRSYYYSDSDNSDDSDYYDYY